MADAATEPALPFRILPRLTDVNRDFWTGGEVGELRFLRCQSCGYYNHPPTPICPVCHSKDLRFEAVSGRATLWTFTVNYQPWMPGPELPYVLAIVALPEQEGLRLTTNLVGIDPEDVEIGMDLEVTFENHNDEVWIPLFRPVTGSVSIDPNLVIERRAMISGVGQSDVGRRLGRDPLELTLDSCLAAIADAGLTTKDIDGVATYPGPMAVPPGFSGAGVVDVQDALRLELGWWSGGIESPGQLGSVINACLAVAAGLATHVLCFRSVFEGSAQGDKGRAGVMPGGSNDSGGFRASGFMEWTLPFAAPSAAQWIAMMAQRHFYEFGTTREQLAQIALNARKNAALNPKAIYTDPMTMEDYLGIRMITTPFCLYDCDAPCDGSTAVIVSRVDTQPDLRRPGIQVEAVGTALRGRPSWDQFDDLTTMANRDASAQMWERTDLKPTDVQLAEMYDGFSFITMTWLEAMGFCGKGESGPFVEGGAAIARDGVLPLNTHGGQLSAGRLHGYGFLHEACVQLWGEAGARQVPGNPEVGVAAAGGGPLAGALLLTRRR